MATQHRLSSRSQTSSKPMDTSRRREMVCNLLTQIFELAERTRVSRHSGESEPISLIELIQASYAVFERYGIGPPDDAVYHRYLLSLSINPERNWRKKLLNFDLGTQPRVKRLCSGAGHRHGHLETHAKVQDSGVQKRQRSGSKQDLVRRASLISPETGKVDSDKDPRQQDQFGDMLSLDSPIQRFHDRNPFPKIANSGLERKIRVVPVTVDNTPSTGKESAKSLQPDRKLQMITTSIEQWRATQAVKQLVTQGKAQDSQTHKQKIVFRCTEAIFHWVMQSLPEKLDFHATESPRALPLCILRRISVDVEIFKKSARRMWIWQTKALLRAWHRDAQRLKAFRVRMIVKQRAAALETVFRCIQSWRLFTETKKCSSDRAQWITQRRSRVKLRECLEHWQRLFHVRNRQKRLNRQYLGNVMKMWQTTAESKRMERNRYELAKKRRIFSCWKEAKERKQTARALLAVSSSQRRLRLLSCSWNELRANVTRNKTERTRMSLWEESSLERWKQHAFRLWKLVADQQRDFQDREKRFLRYSRRRYLRQYFAFWSSWTERQLIIEKLLSDAAEARATKHIFLYFTGWKEHFEGSLRAEEELVASVMRLRRKSIWNRWRKSTAARSATRCLDSAYSLHLLVIFFSKWKKYTSKKADLQLAFANSLDLHKRKVLTVYWGFLVANVNAKHQKQLAAERFRVNRLYQRKREHLSVWKRYICAKRERRLRGDRLQLSVRQSLTRSMWTNWRRSFWMRRASGLADDQLHSYQKSRSFRSWKQFLHGSKQRYLRALKVAEMLENFHLKMCFGLWKKLQTAKHKLANVSDVVRLKVRSRMLTTRWKTWREALEFKRKQLDKVSSAASRWENRKLYASFHSWKTTWCIRKRHRKLLQSMSLVSKQRVLENYFNAWRKSCRTSVAHKDQIMAIYDKLLHFRAKQVIRRWNSLCVERNKRNRLVVKSIELWRQTLLSSTFKRLSQHHHKRKQRKIQSRLVRSRYRTQSMRRIFSVWSTWSRSRELTLKRFEAARRRLETLKRMRALRKLRHNVRSRKTLRTAYSCVVAMRSGHVKVAVLTRWKAFISGKHIVRKRNSARAISMRNFRVRKGIERWKNYVKTRRMLKVALIRAATLSTTSLLSQNFVNWKKFAIRQTFTRSLELKAATYCYFSFLSQYFRCWKTFRCEMKHKRELLLRARSHWYHQTERCAFKAWVEFTLTTCKIKKAVAKWKDQTVSRSFTSWKKFKSLQKKKQREQILAVNSYEKRICLRILREWRFTSRYDRLARNSAQIWRQNAFHRVFATWKFHMKLRQSSRRVVAKLRFLTVMRVFTAWKERIELKMQRLQEIQERFALLWMEDTRQRIFTLWKRFSHLRRFIREKLEDQREILLKNIVKHWRYAAKSRKQSRHCALLVANQTKLSLLLLIWKNWRSRTRLYRCVKALRGKTMSSSLRQRLRHWKRITALLKTVKTLNYRQDTALMRMAFVDGFQRFMQLKRKEKELKNQIGRVHEAYLKEWLATKLQQRMSIIAACEEINRTGSSKRLLSASWSTWIIFHGKKQLQQAAIRNLRGRISHLEERNSLLNAPKLSGILRRWKTVQLVQVFERWRAVISVQQQIRLHTLKAIILWHKMQCKRNFSGWKRFYQYRRKKRRIRAMNTTATLQRSWKFWQMFKIHSKEKKNANLHIRRFRALGVYRSSFKRWREAATSLHSRRLQILELYQSSRLRLLAALIEEWRKFAVMERTSRTQKAVACVVYEQKLARRSFSNWKTNVHRVVYHRHQLQINTERLQVLLLCSSFRAWHSWAKQHKKLTTIMQLLSTKCDSKSASRVFTAWHLEAVKTSRLRHQTVAFWRFCRMRKGIKALRESAQEQVYLRNIHQKAQVFRLALCGTQISVIFARWRKFAVLLRDTKAKTRIATLCWKNAFLRKAWNALVFVHQSGKANRNELARADSHYRSCRLRKTVSFWLQLMKRSQHFRAISGKSLMRWKMQTAYHCFCALQGHAAYTKKLRENQVIFTSKRRTTTTLKTWYAWRKLILVYRSGNRRRLQRFWTVWLRSRASRRVLEGFQEQIQAQVMKSTQRRFMANWKQFVATRKIEKTLMLMSSAFADTQLLRRSWLCWMKHVAWTYVAKTRMKNALIHMQLQLQFKAFRALQTYTNLQKWKIHSTSRALAFQSRQLATRFFVKWRSIVKERITRRRKLLHYLNILQHSTQKKIFTTWHLFVVKRKVLRLKVSQSLAMRTRLCSRMVFQTWKLFLAKVQRNRLAQGFCDAKGSAHALKHWKQYVVLCKVERMIIINDRRLVESNFLSWRKKIAATHQIRAFRAKSARINWMELMGMVFKSWKKRTQTHVHCRKLLASVAIGNHLRFRFMLWQQFTIHRKQLANLLLVVTNPQAIATPTLDEARVNDNDVQSIEELEQRVPELHTGRTGRDLVSLGHALAQKARVLQRFEVTWDLPQTWHRWRQIFHARLFCRMRCLHLFFASWQRFAHRQRRNRFIVIKLTKQRVAISAQTIFRAWAKLVARVKRLQKDRLREREIWVLVNTEMARRERKQLRKHWHAWKFHVEEARHLQKSLNAYHRARLLTKFWLLWCHDFRQIISDERHEIRRLDAQMRRFYLRRALKSLKDHQQRSKRARLVLEYFGNRHYDSLIPKVLTSWRKWSQRQKEIAGCLAVARLNQTRRHFTFWKGWKNTQKWQRIVVDNFQSSSDNQKRRKFWIRWRKYVKNRVAKVLAIEKAAICHVRNRLRKRWLRHTQLAMKLQEQTQTVNEQLCVFRCNRVVNRWREFSRVRRLRRLYQRFVLQKHVELWQSAVKSAIATRFNEFLVRSKVKTLLVAWHQVAAKYQQWRRLCMCFEERKTIRTGRKSFLKWQQFVNARQGKRLAGMHAEQRLLRNVWRCWDRFTLMSQLRRHEQLEQAAEHEAVALLRQSLRVWQIVAKNQRERRFVLLSCVVKLQSVVGQRVQEVTFRSWKRVINHRRLCRVALIKRERKIAKRLLCYWLMWTRGKQRSRQQLENAAVYHSQRLKSAVFFYWQTYSLAWQDAVKPISNQQMALSKGVAVLPRDIKDSEDSDEDVRRPTSPVVKRLREKKANRSRAVANTDESSDTVPLPDAVEISIDVKKRLLLLGRWKSRQKPVSLTN